MILWDTKDYLQIGITGTLLKVTSIRKGFELRITGENVSLKFRRLSQFRFSLKNKIRDESFYLCSTGVTARNRPHIFRFIPVQFNRIRPKNSRLNRITGYPSLSYFTTTSTVYENRFQTVGYIVYVTYCTLHKLT